MKTNFFALLFAIAILCIACNHHPTQTIPSNNWTEEYKQTLLKEIRQSIEFMPVPELNHNEDEIADRALNECIIGYPDMNEFKKHSSYEITALGKIIQEYVKR